MLIGLYLIALVCFAVLLRSVMPSKQRMMPGQQMGLVSAVLVVAGVLCACWIWD